jgi:hypothetical protein
MTDFCHKLRNIGQAFASNRETKKSCGEIALKQGWGHAGWREQESSCSGPKKNWAFEQGKATMPVRHWLDYDYVALAVLVIGLGVVELAVLSI